MLYLGSFVFEDFESIQSWDPVAKVCPDTRNAVRTANKGNIAASPYRTSLCAYGRHGKQLSTVIEVLPRPNSYSQTCLCKSPTQKKVLLQRLPFESQFKEKKVRLVESLPLCRPNLENVLKFTLFHAGTPAWRARCIFRGRGKIRTTPRAIRVVSGEEDAIESAWL